MQLPLYRWLGFLIFMLCSVLGSFAQSQPSRPTNATVSVVEELATALVTAKTEEDRSVLLATKNELVTPALVQALLSQGNKLRTQRVIPETVAQQMLAIFQLALQVAERLEDKPGTAAVLITIGEVYSTQNTKQGNSALALKYYQMGLTIIEQLGDKVKAAKILTDMGHAHRYLSNFDLALESFQKAAKQYEAIGDLPGAIEALLFTRTVLLNNYQSALVHTQQALKLSEASGDKRLVANSLSAIASVHRQHGNAILALETYLKALSQFEELGDSLGMANTVRQIGITHENLGNYSLALDYYRKIGEIGEQAGRKSWISSMLQGMARVYKRQRSYGLAAEYYQKSLPLRNADDKLGVASAKETISELHQLQGNFTLALDYLQQALIIMEQVGIQSRIVNVLSKIGDIYGYQGKYDLALDYYQRALKRSESLQSREWMSNTLERIGNFYLSQDNYELALEFFYKAREAWEPRTSFTRARRARLLNHIGRVYENLGNQEESSRFAEQAAHVARQIVDRELFWHALTSAGRASFRLGQFTQAQTALDEAITTIERMRSQVGGGEQEAQLFFEDKLAPYHAMIALQLAQGKTAEALTYAERAKSRALLDALHGGQDNLTLAMTADEQVQEQRLNNELVSLNVQIYQENSLPQPDQARLAELKVQQQKTRQAYELFQSSLYLAHPELRVKRGESAPLKLTEASSLLMNSKQALLEFVITDEQIYLFVVTHDIGNKTAVKVEVYPLAITAKKLSASVAVFRQQLAKRDPEFSVAAGELYDLLLRPAAAQLQGKTSLVIVPDSLLWELPFQALQSSPNHFLIEDCVISYTPSLTVLREMVKARKKSSGSQPALLAFGNPALGQETVNRAKFVLMDEKFDPLPDAEAQVKMLGRLYGRRQSKIYTGAEAREERAKARAGNYRILHLATHGVLNDASPMYSHLLLAQTESGTETKEDGLLEAWELMKLDLNADLVVLSACETARGRVSAGEGVIGLTWALFVAGCPRTVVSQWKVESVSTTELMVEFHRQLKGRMKNPKASLGVAQGLRASALKMLRSEQYRHPFYWAGFVVMGDGF